MNSSMLSVLQASTAGTTPPAGLLARADKTARELEGTFVQIMLETMFQGLGSDGPLGEGEAGSAWRGMLLQEYGTSIANNGGIGLADAFRREMLAIQEQSNSLGAS